MTEQTTNAETALLEAGRAQLAIGEAARQLVEAHGALLASLPARDRAVAVATVEALREAGLLREAPATRAVVHRIVRDASGQVVASFERVEQLEPVQ